MRRSSSIKLRWDGAGPRGYPGAATRGAATPQAEACATSPEAEACATAATPQAEACATGAPWRYAVIMVVCACRTCFMSCWNRSITASFAVDDGTDGTTTGAGGGIEDGVTRSRGLTICGGWLRGKALRPFTIQPVSRAAGSACGRDRKS